MQSEGLRVSKNGPILEVVLDRPKANAIDAATSREMGRVFSSFRDDPGLRVAILSAAGERFFSAGWDLKAAAAGEDIDGNYGEGGFGGLTELKGLNKPVIAAVNGLAVGGGFELVLSCDLVVAATGAQLFFNEVFVGLVPDAGTFRLPKALPRPLAMDMLLTGRRMEASEAQRWGLVNQVVPLDRLMDTARHYAATIVEAAPLAVEAVKEIARETEARALESCYDLLRSGSLKTYGRMLASEDAREGPRAFAQKRSPVWQGR